MKAKAANRLALLFKASRSKGSASVDPISRPKPFLVPALPLRVRKAPRG
jgi:hypothetical protein